jgi:predicted Fe-Mo cluster-binding NifX family protein
MSVYILIPVASENGLASKIVSQSEMKIWALVEFVDGKAKDVQFAEDRSTFGIDWIDFTVLENKFENYMDFMNEGMMCLVKRKEETVEEVISAFAFKELDEIGL